MSHPNSRGLGWDELEPYDWLSWIGVFSTEWKNSSTKPMHYIVVPIFTIKFAVGPIISLYGKNESLC